MHAGPGDGPFPGRGALRLLGSREDRAGRPVRVDVLYTICAGHVAEAVNDLRQLAVEIRKEPGNLYSAHRSLEDPRKFLIYEQYRSPAALATHRAKDYFQRYSVQGRQKIAESHVVGNYAPL